MVSCDSNEDPSTWSGYEVELFKRVANKLKWPEEQMIWKCMDWTDMENALVAADGTCDVTAAGVPVTGDSISEGVVFSWPTYENGLIIAVSNDEAGASMWAFTDAFEWQLWVVIILTALVVGVIIFAVDAWIYGCKYDKTTNKLFAGTNEESGQKIAFSDYIWDAITRPTQVREQKPLSFASNFIVLAFAFMMLVIVTVYTANTTANITATRLQSTIRGLQDLPGKSVGSWDNYKTVLGKYGIIPLGMPWETEADEDVMIETLTNGTIQALVLDESFLVHRAASNCQIAIVGQKFEELNQAIAFPRGFNNTELIDAVNEALVELKEDGSIAVLKTSFVSPPEASCKSSLVGESTTKISINQLAGLWVMLAVGIGAAIFFAIVYKLHVRYTQKHVDTFSHTLSRKVSLAYSRSISRETRDSIDVASLSSGALKKTDESLEMC